MTLDLRHMEYQDYAKEFVREFVMDELSKRDEGIMPFEVYVVWFGKTLHHYKALLGTTLPDGRYYEVTYNGVEEEHYLDVYQKTENIVIPDEVRAPRMKVTNGGTEGTGSGNVA